MKLQIRPLKQTDREAWAELWRGYLEFYRTSRSEEIYDTLWERLLGDHPYYFQRHGWSVEEVTYLQDLFAAPEVRGTGVGRALIEGVYAAADAAGRPSVYWLTEENNEVGRRLYDRIAVHTPFTRYQRALK